MVKASGVAVTGFLPSACAFQFTNSFPRQPVLVVSVPGIGDVPIGDASNGLCGGMVFAVRDLHEAGVSPPSTRIPPERDTPLYKYIVRRLFDSFDLPGGVARYLQYMTAPDADTDLGMFTRRGIAHATIVDEWPRIRYDLDRGILCPLGVVTVHSLDPRMLGRNHQVLAYGYTMSGTRLRINVYDPNTPPEDADDVYIELDLSHPRRVTPVAHTISIGTLPVRGFFRESYRFTDPRTALAA